MTTCKGCGQPIYFMKTVNDKLIPVNPESISLQDRVAIDNNREVIFDTSKGHISHFATCTKADHFKKK